MNIIFDNTYEPKMKFGKQKYNRLTVISCVGYFIEGKEKRRRAAYEFKCDCGTHIYARGKDVKQGKIQSCGCLALESKSRNGKKNQIDNCLAFYNTILYDYKKNAERRKLEFNIPFDLFKNLISSKCFYCGSSPTNFSKSDLACQLKYNGLDRVDNTKGYVPSNVVSCCKFCNYAKGRGTQKEFQT
jgi:hypothetical protein